MTEDRLALRLKNIRDQADHAIRTGKTLDPHDPRHDHRGGQGVARTRASARAAGARFERSIADWLAEHLDDRIDRRVKTGAKDRGDIGGVRYRGERVVIECKNTTRTNLAGWIREAHLEAGNDDAAIGVVVAKRHGNANPSQQWVHMTLADLAWLLGADHPNYDE